MTVSSSSSLSRGQALLLGLLWCVSFAGCWLALQGSGLLVRLQQLPSVPSFLTAPLELAVRRPLHALVPMHTTQTVLGLVVALSALAVAMVLAARADRLTPAADA